MPDRGAGWMTLPATFQGVGKDESKNRAVPEKETPRMVHGRVADRTGGRAARRYQATKPNPVQADPPWISDSTERARLMAT